MPRPGLFMFVLAASIHSASAETSPPPPAPLSHVMLARLLRQDPARLAALTTPRAVERLTPFASAGSPWQSMAHAALPNPGAMLQLTDGTVMVQDQGANNNGSRNWWKLTPDASGSYLDGTWTQLASTPSDYAPLYFASAVLPNGEVVIEGGEYNKGGANPVWTNLGALYDPVADKWTAVAPPDGGTGQWVRIGDGPGIVLEGGTFMMGASGYSGTTAQALFGPKKRNWTDTGAGKADGNGEEGWSLLPGGDVITVDTDNASDPLNTEIYTPSTGSWTSAGNTPQSLPSGGEIGPQVTRPDGTIFAVGASGHNAVYSPATSAWTAAPDFPVIGGNQFDEADGPAAVLPNGKVLLMASPGEYNTPSHFYLFDGTTLAATTDTPNAASLSSYFGFMMVLPTGQVLLNDRVGNLWVYTSNGTPLASAAPIVTKVAKTLSPGASYTLHGSQLGGRSQGAAYGDDYQSATNFPLVRIVNGATGHVFYARTTGFAQVGVTPHLPGSTQFLVPAGIETGASSLYVVANGVASKPVAVTISP